MDESDLSKRLRAIEKPAVSAESVKSQLRLTLVSARTSSTVGVVLVVVPALFIAGVVLYYGLRVPVPGFRTVEGILTRLDAQRGAPWVAPLVLVVAPLVAFVLNVLAVLHAELDRARRELRLFIRLRPVNLAIAVIALAIVAIVLVHGLADR